MPIDSLRGTLVLRAWEETDAEALALAIGESLDHLRPFLPWIAHEPMTLDARLALIASWATDRATGGDEVCGAFLDGAIVGGSGLHKRLGPGGLEIGYWVHKDYLRRGIATTASRRLTDAAFARPYIDRVEIHHDAANIASAGVPKALGYTLIGAEPRPIQAPAETGVHCIWRITRAEWTPAGP